MARMEYSKIEGVAGIDKVVAIDQSPIGRTPRSNPATYHLLQYGTCMPQLKPRVSGDTDQGDFHSTY